uniref:Uncharacterized protein n=1 Tax=Candidatus Kentrum sp. MB TaxID=2138164 RepID=A0A450XYS0_9GAMM|nr:MAG: hypothetical protein BECKMB1821G_GA0114241_10711 [Candidatus Kentron sp. MB]VFK34393.1 MAG: hypothetical protein BECKMB1821I_GA0114274_107014 [Candidatus Kentron sp. MB]VFK76494.1 MAG: hypothetical protein BECKMB1821H_GA0114242_105914 [Candidatus Kentron sp. MB]
MMVNFSSFSFGISDTLEFVFAASDLIEAGWDAARWNRDSHGTGHTFAQFRSIYDIRLEELKRATERNHVRQCR